MYLDPEKIKEEIKKLEQQREQIVAQINQVLGEIKGKIEVYRSLLEMAEKGTKDGRSGETD